VRATQCPNCEAYIQLGHEADACWRCSQDLEIACGDCGYQPYDLGAGLCFSCGSEPKTIIAVPRKTLTT